MEPTIGAAFQVRTLPVNSIVAMNNQPVTHAVISALTTPAGGGGNAVTTASPSTLNEAHNGPAASGSSSSSQSVSHVKLELWDTAGSERYRSLMPMYFRDASAAVICYDIGNAGSFERVSLWLNDFRKHNEASGGAASATASGNGGATNGDGLVECVLCGTKSDISSEKREVSTAEAQEFANQHGMAFFETSAKRDVNVQELFFSVAHSIFRAKMRAKQQAAIANSGNGTSGNGGAVNMGGGAGRGGGKVDISNEEQKKKGTCC
eukprot:GILJ01029255.1.p1 GENE.GILJ01029255.1~~GILJ01029255.1.p1  ORF type:complete len:286 (-),score=36.62 GILJ01029255.1:230-1021(-)